MLLQSGQCTNLTNDRTHGAVFESAPAPTQNLDLWFGRIDEDRLREAGRRAGGMYTAGFGSQPLAFGGEGLDRVARTR